MSDAINLNQNNEDPSRKPVATPAAGNTPPPMNPDHRESESRDKLRFSGYKRAPDLNKPVPAKKKWFWQ